MIRVTALVLLTLFVYPSIGFSQKGGGDGDYGIFQTQAEYHQFMGDLKMSVRQNPDMKGMIPFINDVVLGRDFGWTSQKYGGESNSLGMLSNAKIRADLEMDDDQFEDLKKLNAEIQRKAAEQIRDLDFSDRDNLVKNINRIRDESRKALGSVLLPHQTKRLSQIRRQSQLRYNSLARMLISDPIREELEIDEEQSEKLLREEEKIEAELAEKIAKLRAEARKDLIKTLKRDQQKKVEELLGDVFEFETGKRKSNGRNNRKFKNEKAGEKASDK